MCFGYFQVQRTPNESHAITSSEFEAHSEGNLDECVKGKAHVSVNHVIFILVAQHVYDTRREKQVKGRVSNHTQATFKVTHH